MTQSSPHPSAVSSRRGILRHLSLPARIVAVLGCLAGGIGFVLAVGDPEGTNPLSWLMFLGPAIAGAFPTLELAWDPAHDMSISRLKRRWILFPVIGAIGAVPVMILAEYATRASGAMYAAQTADRWHFWFPLDGPAVPSIPFGLLGYPAGILLAVAVYVVVLWPLQILRRPHRAIVDAKLDTDPRHARRNRAALAIMPLIVLVAVVIGVSMVFGPTWLAAVSIALEVVLTVAVVLLQRVDAARRRAAGERVGLEIGRDRDEGTRPR